MSRELHKILLTGPPGCGKTTAVMKIVDSLDRRIVAGFYTEENRDEIIRQVAELLAAATK